MAMPPGALADAADEALAAAAAAPGAGLIISRSGKRKQLHNHECEIFDFYKTQTL